MNQVVLVGRLKGSFTKDDEYYINVAVSRREKNADGIYVDDIIKCRLYGTVATNVDECCKTNDVLGIKGRIQVDNGIQAVAVDRVTFLSSKDSGTSVE